MAEYIQYLLHFVPYFSSCVVNFDLIIGIINISCSRILYMWIYTFKQKYFYAMKSSFESVRIQPMGAYVSVFVSVFVCCGCLSVRLFVCMSNASFMLYIPLCVCRNCCLRQKQVETKTHWSFTRKSKTPKVLNKPDELIICPQRTILQYVLRFSQVRNSRDKGYMLELHQVKGMMKGLLVYFFMLLTNCMLDTILGLCMYQKYFFFFLLFILLSLLNKCNYEIKSSVMLVGNLIYTLG